MIIWFNYKYEIFATGFDDGPYSFEYDWMPAIVYRGLCSDKFWIRVCEL